jgi:ubiquinone biosynthesis protein
VPLAAASIAQVHQATLSDGTQVAVKVKRPGIDADFERDLEILTLIADWCERRVPRTRPYRPVAAVEELVVYTRRELDFRLEGEVATRLGAHFADWPDVVIPRIYHASRDLLVMDFVAGFPVDDAAALDAYAIDRQALARTAVNCILEQILMLGLFHADPHPGNLHVTPEGRLLLLDFGIFGELDEATRRDAGLSLLMLAEGQFELAGRYLLRLAMLEPQADPRGYRRALGQLYRAWRHATVGEYGFARLTYDIVQLGARHGVIYPPEVILYVKAMATLEGVSLRMVPGMNLAEEARPYLRDMETRLHDPRRLRRAVAHAWPLWLDMAERLPFNAAGWLDRQWEEPPGVTVRPPARDHARWPILATLAGVALLVAQVGPSWQGLSWLGLTVLALGLWRGHEDD